MALLEPLPLLHHRTETWQALAVAASSVAASIELWNVALDYSIESKSREQ